MSFFRPAGADEGIIQKPHERQHASKRLLNQFVKLWRGCCIGRKRSTRQKLLMSQIVRDGMVRAESSRYPGKLLTGYRAEQPAKCPSFDDRQKRFRVAGKMVPDCVKVFRHRHVQAAADKQLRGGDMEVKGGALVLT